MFKCLELICQLTMGLLHKQLVLILITRKLYFEMAKKMNNSKSFTITATLLQDSGHW